MGQGGSLAQNLRQPVAEEDVVAQDQAYGLAADELRPDEEGIRQPARLRLLGIGEAQPPLAPVLQQPAEGGQILRRADDQNVADPGQHQHRERIVDHRLVVDRRSCLPTAHVKGCKRVPRPPARMIPLIAASPSVGRS